MYSCHVPSTLRSLACHVFRPCIDALQTLISLILPGLGPLEGGFRPLYSIIITHCFYAYRAPGPSGVSRTCREPGIPLPTDPAAAAGIGLSPARRPSPILEPSENGVAKACILSWACPSSARQASRLNFRSRFAGPHAVAP